MKRYRVAIKNSKENRIELSFSDLCVKYSNGFSPTLKVREGEEIPLDVCDPEDLRKSWLVGSLKGYLENKWIEEIQEDIKITEPQIPISQFITEQMVLAPKQNLDKKDVLIQSQLEVPPQSILPETKVIEPQKILALPNKSITDLTKVSSYEDFNLLSHLLKLNFIKETNNLDLLRQIQSLTTSAQIKNNVNLRFSTLKI